jgi:hypothetical protein
MQSENGLMVDVGQVRQVIDAADVFVIGFANFAERLLVDTRTAETAGPMVRVVEPLSSVQERLFWLGKERGAFGMPESFTFFAWPHSIAFLKQSGLWQRMLDRLDAAEDAATAKAFDNAFEDLTALERELLNAAIKGNRFVTLWPPAPAQSQ